ncbi:MAG: hypothetical protein ACLPHI_02645 [Terriglobales bacterium]|jgi:hypothetical protein
MEAPDKAIQTWIVTADSSVGIDTLAKKLGEMGLTIVQVLDVVGAVEVRGSESLAREAGRLPGVANVEKDLIVDVGPPDAQTS